MPPVADPVAMPAMFDCDRMRARLTVAGCTRNWRAAQAERPAPWDSKHHCLSCPIGAAHAGQPPEEARHKRAEEAVRLFCPRCQRPSARLINGLHCVSCYNRVREIARGRNCKGNPPAVVMSRLHAVAFVAGVGGAEDAVEVSANVMGRPEAMILAVNRALRSGRPFEPLRFGQPNRCFNPVPHVNAPCAPEEAA